MKKLLALAVLMATSSVTMAGADCPKAPESEWMPVLELQKKIVNEYGFAIKKFKVDGDCYEIYGWEYTAADQSPVKVEVYFNPVNGDIVKKEVD